MRTAISSSVPRWKSSAVAEHVVAADHRHHAAGLAVCLVSNDRAARCRLRARRARASALACSPLGTYASAAEPSYPFATPRLTMTFALVEHQHAAAQQLRDRLAQRRQRRARGEQRRHLLVRVGRRLDVLHVLLELGARLVRLRERRVRALEVARVAQRDRGVGCERAEEGVLCAVCVRW